METNLTSNKSLLDWLDEKVELLKPLYGLTVQRNKSTLLKKRLLKQAK